MIERVFVIESNRAGNGMDAIRRLRERGSQSVYVTSRPERFRGLADDPFELADECIVADTTDVGCLLHALADQEPDAVMTFTDFHAIPAAVAAAHHGVVGPSLRGLVQSLFKDLTRAKTEDVGYPVRYDVMPLREASTTSRVGYPCVVKPADESGSLGVRVCRGAGEYRDALARIRELPARPSGFRRSGGVLVEQFLEGEEFSAEAVWNADLAEWEVIGFTRKIVGSLPERVEVGHVFPHRFPDPLHGEVERHIIAWLRAVELDRTAAHVEFKIVDGRPALIEVNPRLGGDYLPRLIMEATGVDIVDRFIDIYTISRGERQGSPESEKCAVILFLSPLRSGRIDAIRTPGRLDGVITSEVRTPPIVVEGLRSSGDRLGYVFTSGDSEAAAIRAAERFLEQTMVVYDTGDKTPLLPAGADFETGLGNKRLSRRSAKVRTDCGKVRDQIG